MERSNFDNWVGHYKECSTPAFTVHSFEAGVLIKQKAMITTIVAVIALVLAVCAFFTAIAMGAQTPYADAEMVARVVYQKEHEKSERLLYARQSDYQRGYNDAYAAISRLMEEEKFRARSLDEQKRFGEKLLKATKPLDQLKKDLGV